MKHLFLFFICLFISCSHYPPEMEDVLRQAGKNRKELEKVLNHYTRDPADSLKLRAAEYLIRNMPGHYSEYYDVPWNDVATVCLRWTSSSDKQLVLDAYQIGEPVKKEDIQHITANFLIDNIELAFQSWQDKSWGKHVSFDTFCEEILPYRMGTEPLENWRRKALASFADFNKMFQDTVISAVDACQKVNGVLPKFQLDWDFPPMSFTQIMASRRGSCENQANLAVFVMRALGIPVTFEYTPKWFMDNRGHSWNAVRDSTGKYISFMGAETAPGAWHSGIGSNTTKIYRLTFALQNVLRNVPDTISWEKHENHTKDVSMEYDGFFIVNLPEHFPDTCRRDIYLAAMGKMEWNITGFCDTSVSVHKNGLYLPVRYVEGKQIPANHPFIVRGKDSLQIFKPDTNCLQTINLTALSPISQGWRFRMQNGVFEGANRPDFSDAVKLHLIKDIPEDRFHRVKITHNRKFRYVRYVSPADKMAHCNVAEIKLFDSNDSILQGSPVGTKEVWHSYPEMTYDKVFDGDVSTFFCAKDNNSWTGLDLGEPHRINAIHYLPRTIECNGIYEGHIYELFYFSSEGWKSIGQKTATIHPLQYQIPEGALFYLKNHTLNKTGAQVFFVQDGVQKWI